MLASSGEEDFTLWSIADFLLLPPKLRALNSDWLEHGPRGFEGP